MLGILIDKDNTKNKQLDLKNSSRGINGAGEREQGRDNKVITIIIATSWGPVMYQGNV